MAFVVGSAWVQLLSDDSALRRDVPIQAKAAADSAATDVKVGADTSALQRDLPAQAKAAAAAADATVNVKANVDQAGIRAFETQVAAERPTIDVQANVDEAGVRAFEARVSAERPTVNVQAAVDEAGVRAFESRVAAERPTVNVQAAVDEAGVRALEAKIAASKPSVTIGSKLDEGEIASVIGRLNAVGSLSETVTYRSKVDEASLAAVIVEMNAAAGLATKQVKVTLDVDSASLATTRATLDAIGFKVETVKVKTDLDQTSLIGTMAGLGVAGDSGGKSFSSSFGTSAKSGLARLWDAITPDADSGGSKSGGTFANAFRAATTSVFGSGPTGIMGFLTSPVGAAIAIAAGTFLGPVLGGAIVGSLGLGAIGLAIFKLKDDPQIKAGAAGLASTVSLEFGRLVEPFKQPFAAALTSMSSMAQTALPQLQGGFNAVAGAIGPLVAGLNSMVLNLMPGLNKALEAAGPILTEIGKQLPGLGATLSQFLTDMAKIASSQGGIDALRGAFQILNGVIMTLDVAITGAAQIFAWFDTAVRSTANFFKGPFMDAFNATAAWFTSTWNAVSRTATGFWQTLVGTFTSIKNDLTRIVGDVMGWIARTAVNTWNTVTSDVNKFFVTPIENAFNSTVEGIKRLWTGLKAVVLEPVNFIVETVYDKGILGFWNKIADIIHWGHLDPVHFAEGGVVPGAPGVVGDNVPIYATAGEGMVSLSGMRNLEKMTSLPASEALDMINGNRIGGTQHEKDGARHYWWGGTIINDALKAVNKIESVARGYLGSVVNPVIDAVKHTVDSEMPGNNNMAIGMMQHGVDSLLDRIKAFVSADDVAHAATGIGLGSDNSYSYQIIEQWVKSIWPSAMVTSDLRAYGSASSPTHDYHTTGQAADFVTNGTTTMENLAAKLQLFAPSELELIHNPNASVKNGKLVLPSFWGAETWDAHANHVHIAARKDAIDALLHPQQHGGAGSAPPGQVTDWIRQGLGYWNLADNQQWLSGLYSLAMQESAGNPNAINLTDCVTFDTMILTRRGWLKHDEVRVGDETMGYNPVTCRSEWTRVERVVHYADAPLVRLGNSRWETTTTPNHRWVNLPRSRPTEAAWVQTQDIRSRDRLLLSAPASTSGTLDITTKEAALLGWIAGDGHVEKFRDVPRGRKNPSMSIAQSKPPMVAKLRALLVDVPHAEYSDWRLTRTGKEPCGPRLQFRLDFAYAQDLLRRAGNPKTDAVTQVLAMSTEQREAWLAAMIDAEGHLDMKPSFTKPQVSISQNDGPIQEAILLAVYLSGSHPRLRRITHREPNWAPGGSIHINNPVVTGAFLHKEDAGRGDVWCVTTALGSWTARDGDHVFLTGNSNAAAGHPSKGLLQFIDSTFQANAQPGHGNIWNPVDQVIADVPYINHRYGSILNVPGLVSVRAGGGYVGYAAGVKDAPAGLAMVGERGPELMNFKGGESVEPLHTTTITIQTLNVNANNADDFLADLKRLARAGTR